MAIELKHKKSLNYSYQSDLGPQKQGDNLKGKKSTALRQTDIIGCLRFLEEQIEEEEGIEGNFNMNTMGFRPKSRLKEEQYEKKQMEFQEKQENTKESSDKNEKIKGKDMKKLQENKSSRESSSENGRTYVQKSKELEVARHGISLEVLDEQDDEQVLSELYGLYEQFKHASQMGPSEYGSNHEVNQNIYENNADQNNLNYIQQSQQQAFSGEYFEQLNQQEQEQWFRQYKQQYDLVDTVFHEFLLRSEFYKQRKEERLQYIRGCQIVEENAKLKKYSLMSANSRKLMSKQVDKTNKSVSERSAEMQSKKELEIQGLRRQQQEREMADCTFKPLINSSMKEKRKAQRREEEGEQQQKGLSYSMGLLQEKLPRDKGNSSYQEERFEDQGNTEENGQEIKKKQHLKASKQSHKLFTQLQLRTGKLDFIDRMDCDSEQRAIKKILLENQYSPSFQPHIYQNIRSPAIIQQMQDSIMRFRMSKLQEIQEIDEILRKQQKQKQKQMGYDGQRKTERTKQVVKQDAEDKDQIRNEGVHLKTDGSNVSSSPQRKNQQQQNQMLEPIIEDALKTKVKKSSSIDGETSNHKSKNKANNDNNNKTITGSSNAGLTKTTKIQPIISNKVALEQQGQQQALFQQQFSSQETTTSKNYNSQMSTKFQSTKSDATAAGLYLVDGRVPPIKQKEKQDKLLKDNKKDKIISSNSLIKDAQKQEQNNQNNPKDNEQFRSYLQANINLLKATLHSSS